MRATITNGKIVPPVSVTTAHERVQAVDTEMFRIVEQLADESRRQRWAGTSGYELYSKWRSNAVTKYRAFVEERRQLLAWIDEQELELFRQAVKTLNDICEEEPEALLRDEREMLNRCNEFLNKK